MPPPDDTRSLRLLLAAMGVLQACFLVVRVRPYGESAHTLLLVLLGLTALATLAVVLVPARAGDAAVALLARVCATRRRALGVLLALTAVVGVASVFTQQPFSWDERSVLWAAEVFAESGATGLFARYGESAWLGPQHPPLVPLLYGAVAAVFGSYLKLLRLVNLAFGCGTVAVVFLIVERLYDRRLALVTGLLLLASPLFVRVASAATNDMPLTFLFCLAILVALQLARDDRDRTAVALGLLIGTGLLVKYTMVLVFPVLLALAWSDGSLSRVRRHGPVVVAIAAAMLLAWLDHAYALGILTTQQQRLGRLARVSLRNPAWALDAIVSKTPAALGVYTLPWIVLGAWAARRRLAVDGFVLAWIALVSVPLVLTLPDNRYFLPAFPALLLLAARALLDRPRWTAQGLLLAWLLCAITLALYANVDLAQRAFLFHRDRP